MKLFPRKLKTRWYIPFMVKEIFPHRAIEIIKDDIMTFKVNGYWVKHYEERMPKEVIEGENVISGTAARMYSRKESIS